MTMSPQPLSVVGCPLSLHGVAGTRQLTTDNGRLAGPVQNFPYVPALALRERAGLLDDHAIADVDVRLLAVGEELVGPLDVLLIHPVLDEVLDRDDHGLLHLVRDHH